MGRPVYYLEDRVLVDRATLAALSGRSPETIRRRCPVAEYRDGRAYYNVDVVEPLLAAIPKRHHRVN